MNSQTSTQTASTRSPYQPRIARIADLKTFTDKEMYYRF